MNFAISELMSIVTGSGCLENFRIYQKFACLLESNDFVSLLCKLH